ncbi:hypothetical protein JNW91_16310 [Micromonospora sp. STR1_7]|uniref:DoxX family protein n=1 Tax=Micromonospora parastrephiae TaxID=2806101 RepID=A0ABS1XVI3_9ACTN|nr:hypothetical protein [Micromonospora parastrephiae]MBM0233282.1 hypothetical protein [Micromonospora parastrephiae]
MNVALWVAQSLLALMFLALGFTNLVKGSPAVAAEENLGLAMLFGVGGGTRPHVRFVGLYQMAVGAGLILPGALGWQTWLVPVCALLVGAQPLFDVRRNREMDVPAFGASDAVLAVAAASVAAGRVWIVPL